MFIRFIIVLAFGLSLQATIIQDTNRVDWGYAGATIITRTNLIDVTQSPYFVDNTGATNAATGINAAIVAATSNSVVYLPTGRYMITGQINFNKSDVTLRGAGPTNTIVFATNNIGGMIVMGHSTAQGSYNTITSGATKGSSSFVVSSATGISVGDTGMVSQDNSKGTELFNVMASLQYTNVLSEFALVTGKSGTTITLSNPLGFTYDSLPIWHGLAGSSVGSQCNFRSGLEDIKFTLTNNGSLGSAIVMVSLNNVVKCWMTGCETELAVNYHLQMHQATQCTIAHNYSHGAQSAGSNHAGYELALSSWNRVEDNIVVDGLQPSLEWNASFCNNLIFGNFSSNVVKGFSCHGSHPMMNLFEQNWLGGSSGMDGYFGTGGPNAWFRNRIEYSMYFKRWSTYQQIVGNVMGFPGYTYAGNGFIYEFSGQTYRPYIFQFGYPNVGNDFFTGTNPPISWNYPGKHLTGFSNESITNGIYTFTADQINTTNLSGMFTNIPSLFGSGYTILFQDNVDTNSYWPKDGPLITYAAGTATNLLLRRPTTVSNGWTIYISGQNAYQHLQSTQRVTHTITENYVCTNVMDFTRVFDPTIGDTNVPVSLVYTNGAPSWWGGAAWPAFGPGVQDLIQPNPAMIRYYGALLPPPPVSGNPGVKVNGNVIFNGNITIRPL